MLADPGRVGEPPSGPGSPPRYSGENNGDLSIEHHRPLLSASVKRFSFANRMAEPMELTIIPRVVTTVHPIEVNWPGNRPAIGLAMVVTVAAVAQRWSRRNPQPGPTWAQRQSSGIVKALLLVAQAWRLARHWAASKTRLGFLCVPARNLCQALKGRRAARSPA